MKLWTLTLLLTTTATTFGWAQDADPTDIREQIEALQDKLKDLERGPQDKRRMTEIDPGKPRDGREAGVLRAYDLNDLFAPVPQYPARAPGDLDGLDALVFASSSAVPQPDLQAFQGGMGGGMGGMGGGSGGGFFQMGHGATANAGGAQAGFNELINLIRESTPGPWQETHGDGGTISVLGSTLVIRATLENHLQIERLLDVLRHTWGSMKLVTLEVDWLWLTDQELQTLAPLDDAKAMRTVDAATLSQIKEMQGQDRPSARSAQVTCYNGQVVNVQSVRQVPAIPSLTAVISTNSVGYQPQMRALSDGVFLQLRPAVARSGKFVVVDLHSRLNEIEPGAAPAYNSDSPTLERPTLNTQRLSTSMRAPVGVATVAGGMTHSSLTAAEGDGFNLYVFVKANVQELAPEPISHEGPDATKPAYGESAPAGGDVAPTTKPDPAGL